MLVAVALALAALARTAQCAEGIPKLLRRTCMKGKIRTMSLANPRNPGQWHHAA